MKKRKHWTFSIMGVLLILIGFIFYKTFYSTHRDIVSEKPSLSIEASELKLNYSKDYMLANENYADMVIETKGTITSIEERTIVLNNMVQVDFLEKELLNHKIGQSITVKGRCVGYDDLLEVVKLDQAMTIHN